MCPEHLPGIFSEWTLSILSRTVVPVRCYIWTPSSSSRVQHSFIFVVHLQALLLWAAPLGSPKALDQVCSPLFPLHFIWFGSLILLLYLFPVNSCLLKSVPVFSLTSFLLLVWRACLWVVLSSQWFYWEFNITSCLESDEVANTYRKSPFIFKRYMCHYLTCKK